MFRATARSADFGDATARLELGGSLQQFRIHDGRLVGAVTLSYFKVLDASLGPAAGELLQGVVTENLAELAELLPALELPVRLRQSIEIGGLSEGVVTTRPGLLPLQMTVAEVIPVNRRLWLYIDARAGPWQTVSPAAGP